ncbi:hypothetical protein MKW98_010216 [Papaver atlanticum]|uniref:Cytochrome b n=1 Tax=Papaver atlanticum TaxID=357466 RepID=A0AAD4SL92_9MAGN|nr:hypothetical protein MKW98_010216 [Papaver atlanticum]
MSQKREMTIRNQLFYILKQPIASVLNQHFIDYPTPSNLSYWWGFGSLTGICLVIRIVTDIFLAMHYTPHVDLAFNSVEHIMRDIEGGWLLRYMHANGDSMFFIVVYMHMLRGLYYASYSSHREFVRCIGVVIFLLIILTAYIGYVLPWGQMIVWGSTIITILASAIPVQRLRVRPSSALTIVTWLWGGFSVDNATLNRFFTLHYLLPFILVGASVLHLAALHQYGSNNPLANPMSTPVHIVPEWYFLPVYAILRSIPDKVRGVAAIALVSIFLLALPFLKSLYVRSSSFHPIYQGLFWLLLADRCLLGWIGCQPVEP